SARGVRAGEMGTAAFVSGDLADDLSGAAGDGIRVDWICRVLQLFASAGEIRAKSGSGRGGNCVGDFAVPEDFRCGQNFDAAMDGSLWDDSVGDMGGSAAFPCGSGV